MSEARQASREPLSPPTSWPLWGQYVLALGTMALALGVRWLLNPVLGDTAVPFLTVLAALLVLVLVVRTGPFLLATVVGGVGALLLFMNPRFTLSASATAEAVQLVLFAGAGGAAAFAAWQSGRVQSRRERAEQAAARRSEEIRLVADAMPALISYVDARGRYKFVNARYVEWFVQPADEIVGRELKEVLGEAAWERARPHVETALAGRRSRYETVLPYRYGGARHVVAEYVPHVLEDGSVAGFFALVADVTEQRRAEAAQARLATIVETSGDAITSMSLDGTILTWNAGAERLFGYTAAEVIGKKIELILPPERSSEERDILDRVRTGEVVGPYDTIRRTKAGGQVEVSVTASPIRDASGQVIGVSKVDRDIGARLSVERALRASEQELRTARARERAYLDHLPVGVWFANERGEIVYGNEVVKKTWGGSRMVGRDEYEEYEAYWHGTDRRIGRDDWALSRALRGDSSVGEVIDIVAFDGRRRTVLNSAVPVLGENDEVVGAVVMNLEITELKRAEAALKEADRRKDEFLAALAHELRNPLAAVDSATDLLVRARRLSPEQLDEVGATIRRQVSMMTRLVDDLLDVSRITRGTLELRRDRVGLAQVVEEAAAAVLPWVERERHNLEIDLPDEPVVVDGDALRLVQVLTNLLNNACAYTDPGGRIEILVRREGDEAVIDVRDSGVGIPVEELDKVFEMFTRLASFRDGHPGLGVGLTLSRQIVEMHGGRISAHSEGPGRGATFTIRLPAPVGQGAPAEPAPAVEPAETEQAERRRILVVDDNADVADMLAILLEVRGHEVRTAYDGRSAITETEAFQPDAVLLDLGLPDLDGVMVCKAIRSQPWGRETLVVALSGWGQEEDKRRTTEAGFDAHLTKPARIEQVTELLERAAPARH